MLQSISVHQVVEFLSLAVKLVVAMVRSLFATLVDLLPAPVWGAAIVVVVLLVLYSRLASRIEDLEMALVQVDAKLDTVLSRLARPRDHPERPDAGGGSSA
jgi:uncharacterized membrane protein